MSAAIPAVTADQMREVDRLAVEVYGLQLLQMMENAGRALAELARRMVGGTVLDRRIFVAVGRGNNGGGGLTAARHLANWGAQVTALLEDPNSLRGVPAQQYQAAQAAGVSAVVGGVADLALDALIGYGLKGAPTGWTAAMITRLNESGIPVLALDVPSGLDATSGARPGPCIRAAATLTLALPKTGLLTPGGRVVVGHLYLADIGIPPALYRRLGLLVGSLFAQETLVSLDAGHTDRGA
jgi:NAD(P)H-hydrate epimerase